MNLSAYYTKLKSSIISDHLIGKGSYREPVMLITKLIIYSR